MKRFVLMIALVLALLMLMPTFIACDKGSDTPETTEGAPSSEPEETEAPAANGIKLTEGGKALFTIIRPDECTTSVYNLAKDLGADLKKITGMEFKQDTDFFGWNTVRDPEKYEILVGHTNYDETAEILGDIKYYDYAIAIRGHKIIIAAYTEASLKKALTYFRNNMIPLIAQDADGDFALAFEDQIYRNKYNVESLKLDGNPIEKYVVVYGKDTPAGATLAQSIVDVIASATGIYLPIVNDKEAETEFEILAGKTNRAVSSNLDDLANLSYKVSLQSGKLVIDCHSAETGDAAVRKLYASKMSGGGNIELTSGDLCEGTLLIESVMPMTAGSDLRIITYNVLTEKWGGTETSARAEYFGAFLDVYKPDIVGVQEVCDKWRKYMPERIGNYKLIGTTRKDGGQSYSAIVYDSSKYEVLAQGVETYSYHASAECRNMSWAIFMDTAKGVKFAFISTHWDFGEEAEKQQMRKVQAEEMSKKIADLKAEYNCPVIITGDFNCNTNSDSYQYFMSMNGMVNALTSSEHYYNAKGTTSIDLIMITNGDGVFKGYRKLIDNGIAQISDHPANLADIDLIP
ncbi:MAG: endonuclease/exonuclease/phosphatase family protein [Clostridia bacterium]|nr:endonuclease/exonuclease/phosphatase family protein [Clostridia bacterium]